MANDSVTIFTIDDTAVNEGWEAFLTTSDIESTLNIPGAKPNIQPSSLTCTSQRFWNLPFSTDGNQKRFQQNGYIIGNDVYILGLSSSFSDPQPSLADILTKFGVTDDQWQGQSITKAVLSAIATSTKFSIDPSETRNAVWLVPGITKSMTVELAFKAELEDNVLANITSAVCSDFGITLPTINPPQLLVRRKSFGVSYYDGTTLKYQISSTFRFTIKLTVNGFIFWISLDPSGVRCTVTMDPAAGVSDFWSRLDTLNASGLSSSTCKPDFSEFMSHISFQSASIGKTVTNTSWWEVKCILKCSESTSTTDPVDIFLTYDSLSSTFAGGLVLQNYFPSALDMILPDYDIGTGVEAPPDLDITKIPPAWDLKQLFAESSSFPEGIPTAIGMAEVTYINSDPKTFSFRAALVNPQSATDHKVPVPFSWDGLEIQATKSTDFSCSAQATFTLSVTGFLPADLGLGLDYTARTWQVSGWADNLSCGLLHGFFDSNYADPLVQVLGKLTIKSLNMLYTHSSSGGATSFFISGTITMGELELRMFFQYASSDAGADPAAKTALEADSTAPKLLTVQSDMPGKTETDWSFECDLGASDGTATIGTILNSIVDNSGDSLPDFVKNIAIPAATGTRSPVQLKVGKNSSTQVVFVLRIIISSISVFFIQVAGANEPTKRILRVLVDKIPLIQDIPVINQLPQPFDDLEYMWVSDSSGLLESDVTSINNVLDSADIILYKKTTKDNPGNVAIVPGNHFTVIENGAVALDHVFETGASAGSSGNTAVAGAAAPADPTPAASNTSTGSVNKTLGPLSISAVSLQYKEKDGDKHLWITLDAIFTMGPISFALLGFGIGLPMNNVHLNDLSGILSSIEAQLNGMALGFNNPPILLTGVFEHESALGEETYMGGVGISFPPYTFVAVGEYKILNSYKSVFIYAKLDGPLITLEFATISGVRLGFGLNSNVRSPTIDQLTSFPFINDAGTSGAGNDPIKILAAMTQSPSGDNVNDPAWVTSTQDQYWFAAGMTITAFDVLTITAVAMFAFKEAGLIVSLYADAVAQMPPDVKDKTEMVLYVEIGLVAEMNFIDAYFRVEASLAPSSFLLVPQCHLTGGFALVYWFGSNPHAGDFVFSVGGYHRQYTPPDWYPVPARLGISFQVGNNVSITGQAYFAVTPKVAMGGALIHASLSIGPVDAWLDAAFDALINFHPLHYEADFRVSIGVSFNIDFWFVHIHISCSVGADLHIEGPEFGGYAYVDFYLFAFTVDFGASPEALPPVALDAFWRMVHKPGPASDPPQQNDFNPIQATLAFDIDNVAQIEAAPDSAAAFKFILEDGNFPQPKARTTSPAPGTTGTTGTDVDLASTGTGAKWFVKGGTFRFRVVTDFALSEANVTVSTNEDPSKGHLSSPAQIFSQPMHVSDPITSTLTITIRELSTQSIISDWQNVSFYIKSVPTGIWSSYNPNLDLSTLLKGDNATTPLPMGLLLQAPKPFLAPSLIPAFSATAAAKFGVLDFRTDTVNGTNWFLPNPEPTQTVYLPQALTSEQQAETPVQRWAEFQSEWEGMGEKESVVTGTGTSEGMLDLVTGVFGWDRNRPQGEVIPASGTPVWKLNGRMPERLIKGLGSLYLALPRVAVSTLVSSHRGIFEHR